MTIRLEVCVDSVVGLDVAVAGGADRIELCSALALGGLTPSHGLLTAAAARDIPCFVLIRARAGDFRYDSREIDVMRRDIAAVRSKGLAGVVIGASLPDGRLDEAALGQLLEEAAGMSVVLHRAFDLVPDFHDALETAIRLGFKRVLTSGGAVAAADGSEQIRRLVQQAGDRIEVMAGAGLSADNVGVFVKKTGVEAVHSSCSSPVDDPSTVNDPNTLAERTRALGFTPAGYRTTDPCKVAAMIETLRAIGARA